MSTSTTETARDYSADMNAFINERLFVTDSAAALARTIFEQLLEQDPDLLDGWVSLHALDLIKKAVGDRHRAERARNRQLSMREPVLKAKLQVADTQARMGNLRPAADLSSEIKESQRTKFLAERYTDDEGVYIALGDMKRAHRQRVVKYHDTMGRAHLTRKAFIMAIDEKCGEKATSDRFTEEELSALWRKLNGVKEIE